MTGEHPIRWNRDTVSRLWDYYARHRPFSDAYFSKVYGRSILGRSRLPLANELEVLDFGCGPGFIWDHLRGLGARWNYTGLDFSSSSVQAASSRGQGHPQFKGVQHVERLPTDFPGERFDAVLLFEVVEHLADEELDATLREVHRLLKRGGVAIVTTPNDEDLALATKFCPECGAVFHEWQHVRTWTAESLQARLGPHGLSAAFIESVEFAGTGVARALYRLARRLIKGERKPHLIAAFQKRR